jgi:hypothetical protein
LIIIKLEKAKKYPIGRIGWRLIPRSWGAIRSTITVTNVALHNFGVVSPTYCNEKRMEGRSKRTSMRSQCLSAEIMTGII